MNVKSLEQRVSRLERPAVAYDGLDPLILAMEACCLKDSDCGLLQELMSLGRSGFSHEQIQDMMSSESYVAAIGIAERIDVELRRLEAMPARPKRNGRLLKASSGWEGPDFADDKRF